jgi:hypothetical protein
MTHRIGDRVRLVKRAKTERGTVFAKGELMIVEQLRLLPWGAVHVSLRTVDGRKLDTWMRDKFVPG